MRAGKLEKVIELWDYSFNGESNEYGVPIETWTLRATLRGQRVDQSTDEYVRNYGTMSETVTVFRTRHIDGVSPADQLRCDGLQYNIKQIKPIGRRRGLELRCVAWGGGS